ncbi:MAG: dTMP kinase [Candidatus Omnitrophota bacterium]
MTTTPKRGLFVCIEGIDGAGKTTQVDMLVAALRMRGIAAVAMRFPDRRTPTGRALDAYLAATAKTPEDAMDPHTAHLLFSANRWEKRAEIERTLAAGTTIVVDRYIYSGIAYSVAKGLDLEWCKAADRGLPVPDVVLYLAVPTTVALERIWATRATRERHDSTEVLDRVARAFDDALLLDAGPDTWAFKVDATLYADILHGRILEVVLPKAATRVTPC